jgi:hypothetical protein
MILKAPKKTSAEQEEALFLCPAEAFRARETVFGTPFALAILYQQSVD